MNEAGFPQPDELFVQVRMIRSEIERLTATLKLLCRREIAAEADAEVAQCVDSSGRGSFNFGYDE
jgi:hypothetical protein